jgi:muramoyltetrapeptide carboxypeptidase
MIKPEALKPGDTIAIVAPASPVGKTELLQGIKNLRQLGFRIKYHPRIYRSRGYLAGRDNTRGAELNNYFADPKIKAIFCARGGYGSLRILDKLDPLLIKHHPKIFMGYSDITSLLLYLQFQCSLVVFHGPMVGPDFNHRLSKKLQHHMLQLLGSSQPLGVIKVPGIQILHPGKAHGILTGGCLSLVTLSIGTPWEINTEDKILFLEDMGEAPYRIDRMLSYLKLVGKFSKVRGLVFGRMPGCSFKKGKEKIPQDKKIPDVIREVLREFSIPIIYNFPSGHGGSNYPLPFGVQVSLDATAGILTVEEGAVK